MIGDTAHPARTLLRVLGGRARIALGLSAATLFFEKVALVAASAELVGGRLSSAALLGGLLAVSFFVRSASRSYLRVEVQSRLLGAVITALFDEDAGGLGANVEERELALFTGLFASEALFSEHLPELFGDIPGCVCVLAMASSLLPGRTFAEGGGAMLLGAGALLVARRISGRITSRVWEAYEPLLDDLSASVRGRLEFVASGTRDAFLSLLSEKIRRWRSVSTHASFLSFLAGRAPAVAVAFGACLVLLVDESARGTLGRGGLGHAALIASMTPAFAGVARAWLEVDKSGARIRPVAALLARGSSSAAPRGDAPPPLPAPVIFEHIVFSYGPSQRAVLQDLVFHWHPGEVVALTGPNGSGKSTLLMLLLGLAKPERGVISIAGRDLQSMDARAFRRRVGFLSQRPFLPDRATVGGAMRLLAPDAGSEDLEPLLRRVKLWPVLVRRSPDSPLNTRVGSLSAGEKQRLALARVLARRAPLLLLDEPDANLDADGVELLVSLIRELAPGRMIAVAAHGPRLIAAADRVLKLGCAVRPSTPAIDGCRVGMAFE
jgi:ABC-type multidrug transport system fused ATPase/permease subunit